MDREGVVHSSPTIRASIILCQDFKESLWVLTDWALVGNVLSFKDVAAISAVPLRRCLFIENGSFGDILQ